METKDKTYSQKELLERLLKLQSQFISLQEDHNKLIEALNLDIIKFGVAAFTPSVRFVVNHLLGMA